MSNGNMAEALDAVEDEGTEREPHTRAFAHPDSTGFAYFDVDDHGATIVSEELLTIILLAAGFVEVDVPNE